MGSAFKKETQKSGTMSTSPEVEYLCLHVLVSVKKGTEEAFKAASLENATNSAKEEGCVRYDVLQQGDDPTKFKLVEVYKNGDAISTHKGTAHFLKWKETVADMMAEPRKAVMYKNMFPMTASGWEYGEGTV